MMEESIKSNLKIKALIILLIATLLLGVSTLFCTVKAADEESDVPVATEETQEDPQEDPVITPKLNSKIYFEGKTYKLPNKDRVRKEYKDGELGCGIISIISKRAKHPVYVSGEGWIDAEQIKDIEKYITLTFEKTEGLKSTLKINGEFVNAESANEGIIKYENGELRVVGNGTTTVNITKKDGETIEALATVVNGELTLNIPEKTVTGELSATAEIADKITVEASGNGAAALVIDENGIGVAAEGEASANLKVDEKEIASVSGDAQGSLVATKDGVVAEGTASQTMTILEKLKIRLSERANAEINKEEAAVSVGGDVEVNDNEVASGDAGLSYNYQEEDPKGSLKAEILGNEIVNVEEKPIRIISTLKNLMASLRAR